MDTVNTDLLGGARAVGEERVFFLVFCLFYQVFWCRYFSAMGVQKHFKNISQKALPKEITKQSCESLYQKKRQKSEDIFLRFSARGVRKHNKKSSSLFLGDVSSKAPPKEMQKTKSQKDRPRLPGRYFFGLWLVADPPKIYWPTDTVPSDLVSNVHRRLAKPQAERQDA
jgi:hypothetical protein